MKNDKFFVSIIYGYFHNLHHLSPEENYHLHALKIAKDIGYKPVAIIKGGENEMRTDPNYDRDIVIISYKNFFHFMYQVMRYIRKGSVFYVNSYEWQSFVVPFFSRRAIFMAHTQPNRRNKAKQIIQDLVYRFFWRIRLNNETEREFLLGRTNEKKLFIVPLVVSLKYFFKENSSVRKDVVYFGNVTAKKNLPTILKAMVMVKKARPGIKLNIVGKIADDSFRGMVTKLHLDDTVILHGFTPLEELSKKLNQYLIYVNSSFDEGQCVAVYDSALCGCALCLPKISSFIGVFKDKALFHGVSDHETLAKNILRYLDDPKMMERDNEACIKMIKNDYNKETIERKMRELFTLDEK
jgi:glycosyltransferase involved in cell wall biosynthesis